MLLGPDLMNGKRAMEAIGTLCLPTVVKALFFSKGLSAFLFCSCSQWTSSEHHLYLIIINGIISNDVLKLLGNDRGKDFYSFDF